MPIESKFIRVEADDPKRCQAVTATNQCPYKAIEGTINCPMHAGRQASNIQQQKKRMYQLTQWANRVGEIADHEQVKSLREEIGIARMLLENIVNVCHDSTTLLLYSSKISDLVTRVEKLVSSCHRLEAATGMLLDKSTALNIGASIVDIVSQYVTDEESLDQIGTRIVESILQASMKTEGK